MSSWPPPGDDRPGFLKAILGRLDRALSGGGGFGAVAPYPEAPAARGVGELAAGLPVGAARSLLGYAEQVPQLFEAMVQGPEGGSPMQTPGGEEVGSFLPPSRYRAAQEAGEAPPPVPGVSAARELIQSGRAALPEPETGFGAAGQGLGYLGAEIGVGSLGAAGVRAAGVAKNAPRWLSAAAEGKTLGARLGRTALGGLPQDASYAFRAPEESVLYGAGDIAGMGEPGPRRAAVADWMRSTAERLPRPARLGVETLTNTALGTAIEEGLRGTRAFRADAPAPDPDRIALDNERATEREMRAAWNRLPEDWPTRTGERRVDFVAPLRSFVEEGGDPRGFEGPLARLVEGRAAEAATRLPRSIRRSGRSRGPGRQSQGDDGFGELGESVPVEGIETDETLLEQVANRGPGEGRTAPPPALEERWDESLRPEAGWEWDGQDAWEPAVVQSRRLFEQWKRLDREARLGRAPRELADAASEELDRALIAFIDAEQPSPLGYVPPVSRLQRAIEAADLEDGTEAQWLNKIRGWEEGVAESEIEHVLRRGRPPQPTTSEAGTVPGWHGIFGREGSTRWSPSEADEPAILRKQEQLAKGDLKRWQAQYDRLAGNDRVPPEVKARKLAELEAQRPKLEDFRERAVQTLAEENARRFTKQEMLDAYETHKLEVVADVFGRGNPRALAAERRRTEALPPLEPPGEEGERWAASIEGLREQAAASRREAAATQRRFDEEVQNLRRLMGDAGVDPGRVLEAVLNGADGNISDVLRSLGAELTEAQAGVIDGVAAGVEELERQVRAHLIDADRLEGRALRGDGMPIPVGDAKLEGWGGGVGLQAPGYFGDPGVYRRGADRPGEYVETSYNLSPDDPRKYYPAFDRSTHFTHGRVGHVAHARRTRRPLDASDPRIEGAHLEEVQSDTGQPLQKTTDPHDWAYPSTVDRHSNVVRHESARARELRSELEDQLEDLGIPPNIYNIARTPEELADDRRGYWYAPPDVKERVIAAAAQVPPLPDQIEIEPGVFIPRDEINVYWEPASFRRSIPVLQAYVGDPDKAAAVERIVNEFADALAANLSRQREIVRSVSVAPLIESKDWLRFALRDQMHRAAAEGEAYFSVQPGENAHWPAGGPSKPRAFYEQVVPPERARVEEQLGLEPSTSRPVPYGESDAVWPPPDPAPVGPIRRRPMVNIVNDWLGDGEVDDWRDLDPEDYGLAGDDALREEAREWVWDNVESFEEARDGGLGDAVYDWTEQDWEDALRRAGYDELIPFLRESPVFDDDNLPGDLHLVSPEFAREYMRDFHGDLVAREQLSPDELLEMRRNEPLRDEFTSASTYRDFMDALQLLLDEAEAHELALRSTEVSREADGQLSLLEATEPEARFVAPLADPEDIYQAMRDRDVFSDAEMLYYDNAADERFDDLRYERDSRLEEYAQQMAEESRQELLDDMDDDEFEETFGFTREQFEANPYQGWPPEPEPEPGPELGPVQGPPPNPRRIVATDVTSLGDARTRARLQRGTFLLSGPMAPPSLLRGLPREAAAAAVGAGAGAALDRDDPKRGALLGAGLGAGAGAATRLGRSRAAVPRSSARRVELSGNEIGMAPPKEASGIRDYRKAAKAWAVSNLAQRQAMVNELGEAVRITSGSIDHALQKLGRAEDAHIVAKVQLLPRLIELLEGSHVTGRSPNTRAKRSANVQEYLHTEAPFRVNGRDFTATFTIQRTAEGLTLSGWNVNPSRES